MKRFLQFTCLAILCSFIAGCNSVEKRVTKLPKKPLPKIEKNISALKSAWKNKAGSGTSGTCAVLAPDVSDGNVYTSDSKGNVYAYAGSNGKKIWESKIDGKVSSAIVASDNGLLVAGGEKLSLLDYENGKQKWSLDIGSEIFALPGVSKTHAFVHLLDGFIISVDLGSGSISWRYAAQTPSIVMRKSSSPVVDSGRVYTGLANGRVVSLKQLDGSLSWEQDIGNPIGKKDIQRMADVVATPVLDSSSIYLASYQGYLSALDKSTGSVLWQHPFSSLSGGAIAKGNLYYTNTSGHLISYNKSTGKKNWTDVLLEGRVLTAPVYFENRIYVGDEEGFLHSFDLDGNYLTRVKLSSAISSTPVTNGDHMLVLSSNGSLYMFRG